MKRNKDAQYRIKLIQENHYDKIEQRLLDREASLRDLKYKEIYEKWKCGLCLPFMAAIAMKRASKAMVKAGVAAVEFSKAIRKGIIYCLNMADKIN